MTFPKRICSVLLTLIWVAALSNQPPTARAQTRLPNPVLVFTGAEYYNSGGKSFVRYRFSVHNFEVYPNELFAPSPTLPPCGQNTNAARTWVDIYEQNGKRLYGFCALGKPNDLNSIWFALEEGVIPPSWVYMEMNDRQTGTKYKSNLAPTVL